MTHLIIKKKNEVFVTVESEQHVYHELSDHFTFEVPGARFMPQYKSRVWDGKIRLFNQMNGELYVGLLPFLRQPYGTAFSFLISVFFFIGFIRFNRLICFS